MDEVKGEVHTGLQRRYMERGREGGVDFWQSQLRQRFDQLGLEEFAAVTAKEMVKLQQESLRDWMTGALSLKAITANAQNELDVAAEHPNDLGIGIAVFDLDRFKKVAAPNNRVNLESEERADEVIKNIVGLWEELKATQQEAGEEGGKNPWLRATLGRIGGDEFAIVASGVSRDEFETMMEAWRKLVEEKLAKKSGLENETETITTSIGGVWCGRQSRGAKAKQVLEKASGWLERAKLAGRNRVEVGDLADQVGRGEMRFEPERFSVEAREEHWRGILTAEYVDLKTDEERERYFKILAGQLDAFEADVVNDALTGIYNRGAFMLAAGEVRQEERLADHELTWLLVDIDLFKEVNTNFGYEGGNEVLKLVAGVLGRELPGLVILGRYRPGGQFMGLMIHSNQDREEAVLKVHESLCGQLSELRGGGGRQLRDVLGREQTVSIVAVVDDGTEEMRVIQQKADEGMNRIKLDPKIGRGGIVMVEKGQVKVWGQLKDGEFGWMQTEAG